MARGQAGLGPSWTIHNRVVLGPLNDLNRVPCLPLLRCCCFLPSPAKPLRAGACLRCEVPGGVCEAGAEQVQDPRAAGRPAIRCTSITKKALTIQKESGRPSSSWDPMGGV